MSLLRGERRISTPTAPEEGPQPWEPVRQTTSCRADPMTVSGQFSCPPPGSFVAVSGQFLVAADSGRRISDSRAGPSNRGTRCREARPEGWRGSRQIGSPTGVDTGRPPCYRLRIGSHGPVRSGGHDRSWSPMDPDTSRTHTRALRQAGVGSLRAALCRRSGAASGQLRDRSEARAGYWPHWRRALRLIARLAPRTSVTR
ncbi:hypothetical protein ARZXY2_4068 [Arthrobacter sp. ZXY-2]|nr:hypothetical protein ARZXY2_4068 [Arthrobacter sp. ZXY-2]